jgi:hypothetical protein
MPGWIHRILHSANISISVNGRAAGFFKCQRGVRQGDPLSPLLFCIAEEALDRGITHLVETGKLTLIKGARGTLVPSHVMYVDDLMIFCKGSISNINNLKDLFYKYGMASGQLLVLTNPPCTLVIFLTDVDMSLLTFSVFLFAPFPSFI